MKAVRQAVFLWLNHIEEMRDEKCRGLACECYTCAYRIHNPKHYNVRI